MIELANVEVMSSDRVTAAHQNICRDHVVTWDGTTASEMTHNLSCQKASHSLLRCKTKNLK
ncbi:unnamed protein product [Leptidea sinapis]|uniref:Uncharacterized protein n=1 Tax=Leptidea sinapis TaxID=189913 RepID=A0A5E4Q257_9NEOP|nr:unnamed protein product [Leptidea sinapis]